MIRYNRETRTSPTAAGTGVRENERGTPDSGIEDNLQYGRRIETDRSWTVYHVFTGIPAQSGGDAMTDLSQSDATTAMEALNLRKVGRRIAPKPDAEEKAAAMECSS